MATQKIKITKCSNGAFWYNGLVGQTLNVSSEDGKYIAQSSELRRLKVDSSIVSGYIELKDAEPVKS